jgi:ribosome-interacting GTPase 1
LYFKRYEEAVVAYEEALVLEPDNKGTKASIAQAKGKIAELEKKSALASSSGERVCCAMSAMCSFSRPH